MRFYEFADFLFPTRVGMNRIYSMNLTEGYTVPHASGDEPMSS